MVQQPAKQPRYVTKTENTQVAQKDRNSVFTFTVPAHVPVDRVMFTPGAQPVLFSRDVNVKIEPVQKEQAADQARYPQTAAGSGNLLRVHTVQNGHHIDEERLTIDAPRAEFETPSKWTITTENGEVAPRKGV